MQPLLLALAFLAATTPEKSPAPPEPERPTPADVLFVRVELARMEALDQSFRNLFSGPWNEPERTALMKEFVGRYGQVDQQNTEALKRLVRKWGWVRSDLFGADAARHAWLLVQHADHDRAWQKEVLPLLEGEVRAGRAEAKGLAYLTDRLLSGEERPQRYGTQGRCTGPGTWEPFPVEDPATLDARRREVGLPAMDEYRAKFRDVCREAQPPRKPQ